jgi:hypothetical protein
MLPRGVIRALLRKLSKLLLFQQSYQRRLKRLN